MLFPEQEQAPEWAPKSNPGKSERLQSEFLGESIKLDCQAKGKPSPKVTWFKDGQKLEKGNGRLTVSTGSGTRLYNFYMGGYYSWGG